jgi:hypothetical protein
MARTPVPTAPPEHTPEERPSPYENVRAAALRLNHEQRRALVLHLLAHDPELESNDAEVRAALGRARVQIQNGDCHTYSLDQLRERILGKAR